MTREPAEGAALLAETIRRVGGVIVDSTRFANKALSYKVECYAKEVQVLVQALAGIGAIHHAGEQPTGAAPLSSLDPASDVLVLLHVSLVHGQPDQRVALPKVPG